MKVVIKKCNNPKDFIFECRIKAKPKAKKKIFNRFKFRIRLALYAMKYYDAGGFFFAPIEQFGNLLDYCKQNNLEVICEPIVYQRYKNMCRCEKRITKRKSVTSFDCSLIRPEIKIEPYQAKAINAALAANSFMIGDDMGIGKTLESIAVMCKAFEEYEAERALIVLPASLTRQWEEEINKFTFLKDDVVVFGFDKIRCSKRKGKFFAASNRNDNPCKFCDLREVCKLQSDKNKIRKDAVNKAKILLISYKQFTTHVDKLVGKFDVTIFDESTALKNKSSQQGKAGIKYSEKLPRGAFLLLLSGTFMENGLHELYVPLAMVRKGYVGEFYEYSDKYFIKNFFGVVEGIRNEKVLKGIVKKCMIRRTRELAWKDRPKYSEIIRHCPLCDSQRKMYDKICAAKLNEIEDLKRQRSINKAMAASVIGYLLQCTDTMKAIDEKVKSKDHSSKIEMLLQMIDTEIDKKSKIVIFSRFANRVVPHIVSALRKYGKVAVSTGSTPDAASQRDKFIKDKNCRFLVCSDAVARGANLQCANYLVNFDLPWNPAIIDQRIGRCYRKGQKKPVTVINFLATDTIEEYLYDMINSKRSTIKKIFGGGKNKEIDLVGLLSKI